MKRTLKFMFLAALVVGTVVACSPATSGTSGGAAATAEKVNLRPAVSGERRFLELPGFGRVAYYASEMGTGRPLILTHSVNAAASAYEMKPIWDTYVGTRPIYALEWPGFGSSDRPDIRYTRELMTSALTALVSQLNQEVDVVGLSLGSEFAARAALSDGRIKSLALISPSGLGKPRGGSQEAQSEDGGQRLYRSLNSVGTPLYAILRTQPSIEYFLDRSFRGPVDSGLVNYGLETTRQPGAKYAPLYFVSGQLFTADAYAELYSKLTIPTVVLYDQDAFVRFDRLPNFTQQAGVTAVRIPETDGLPHFEKMTEVKAALDAFWSR